MSRYIIEATTPAVILGIYEGDTAADAIQAMMTDAGDEGEPDSDLVAYDLEDVWLVSREIDEDADYGQVKGNGINWEAGFCSTPWDDEMINEMDIYITREGAHEVWVGLSRARD